MRDANTGKRRPGAENTQKQAGSVADRGPAKLRGQEAGLPTMAKEQLTWGDRRGQ